MKRLATFAAVTLKGLWNLLRAARMFAIRIVVAINRRKRYAIPFYSFTLYLLAVVIIIKTAGDPDYQKVIPNKRINDVTGLNAIQITQTIRPTTADEIIQALKSSTGPVSIGGGRFSMGGQTSYENSLHIDMRKFNRIVKMDTVEKQVTVQSGVTWRQLQSVIDPLNLSVKIMQTYANFTVGGSVSVNCHGRYIGHGPIVSSVLGLKLITASGEEIYADRTTNREIFAAAVGGYGGIGVITEITLQLTDNVKVERQVAEVNPEDYNRFFNQHVRNDDQVIFQNGDLYPPHFDRINSVSWKKTEKPLTDTTRVTATGEKYWLEHNVMEVVSWGDFGKWFRRTVVDPYVYGGERVVWRNREASYDVQELEPSSREDETYVLQEYFIPVDNFKAFIPKMKKVFDEHDVNVINVSIRHAHADEETYLSWAAEEVFAFVIYFQQGTDIDERERVREWTVAMTDAILSENGRWYLPYQPHATVEQFKKGYVKSDEYFRVKARLDPDHRFTNKLLDKYNPFLDKSIERKRNEIRGYFRDEGQSVLTVPEWYLVFNPKEYADFLEAGKNPSDFPFYSSIDEYWTLYERSLKLASAAYPPNDEYKTMLDVIGVSITLEYTGKMVYEKTIGRMFSWLSNATVSDEEKVIFEAHRAYSDFIYDVAWYEFEFMPWVKKVWATDNTKESNWFRKVERKLFFTFEFSLKAVYAQLINWAATASYEEPVTDIYVLASSLDSLTSTTGIQVLYTEKDKKVMSIARWGAFTKTLIENADKEISIHEISGNDEIVVSVLSDVKTQSAPIGEELYRSAFVTNANRVRTVYLVQVDELMSFIRQATTVGIEVEHIYDY
jgi:FAD/FMN-containing dehydrogenase